eukprot:scaffold16864_cov27-Tisochrysis_lutea.AAC.6
MERYARSARESGEPVCETDNRGNAYVQADDGIPYCEWPVDERFGKRTRWLAHGIIVGRIEGERSGGEAIGDKIHP